MTRDTTPRPPPPWTYDRVVSAGPTANAVTPTTGGSKEQLEPAVAARALIASVAAEAAVATKAAKSAAKSAQAAAAAAAVNASLKTPRAGARRPPCTFFVRGMCRFGRNCRHSHDVQPWGRGEQEEKVVDQWVDEGEVGDGLEWDADEELAAKEASLDEEERVQVGCRYFYLGCCRKLLFGNSPAVI